MVYSPYTIANDFLRRGQVAKMPLTPMKLQKLVSFAHAWCLALHERPLLNTDVEAWDFGPVIPELYHRLIYFGMDPVTGPLPDEGERIDDETQSLLKGVWDVYSPFSAIQLANLTHDAGMPWDEMRKFYGGVLPGRAVIPERLIRERFKTLLPARTANVA